MMSQIRQTSGDGPQLVRTLGLRLPPGAVLEGHKHRWAQVVFASRGLMQVDAEGNRWVVPPMRCLFVPAGTDHTIKTISETELRTIYLRPDLDHALSPECSVLDVSGLLRELILEVVRRQMLSEDLPSDVNLAAVLTDQLAAAREVPLKIRMPEDPRGRALADIISDDPTNKVPLENFARRCGASIRTLERVFLSETGLSVGRWRQRVRLMMGIRLLIDGNSVAGSAAASGYESASAFVAMFKKEMGTTPGHYLQKMKAS